MELNNMLSFLKNKETNFFELMMKSKKEGKLTLTQQKEHILKELEKDKTNIEVKVLLAEHIFPNFWKTVDYTTLTQESKEIYKDFIFKLKKFYSEEEIIYLLTKKIEIFNFLLLNFLFELLNKAGFKEQVLYKWFLKTKSSINFSFYNIQKLIEFNEKIVLYFLVAFLPENDFDTFDKIVEFEQRNEEEINKIIEKNMSFKFSNLQKEDHLYALLENNCDKETRRAFINKIHPLCQKEGFYQLEKLINLMLIRKEISNESEDKKLIFAIEQAYIKSEKNIFKNNSKITYMPISEIKSKIEALLIETDKKELLLQLFSNFHNPLEFNAGMNKSIIILDNENKNILDRLCNLNALHLLNFVESKDYLLNLLQENKFDLKIAVYLLLNLNNEEIKQQILKILKKKTVNLLSDDDFIHFHILLILLNIKTLSEFSCASFEIHNNSLLYAFLYYIDFIKTNEDLLFANLFKKISLFLLCEEKEKLNHFSQKNYDFLMKLILKDKVNLVKKFASSYELTTENKKVSISKLDFLNFLNTKFYDDGIFFKTILNINLTQQLNTEEITLLLATYKMHYQKVEDYNFNEKMNLIIHLLYLTNKISKEIYLNYDNEFFEEDFKNTKVTNLADHDRLNNLHFYYNSLIEMSDLFSKIEKRIKEKRFETKDDNYYKIIKKMAYYLNIEYCYHKKIVDNG